LMPMAFIVRQASPIAWRNATSSFVIMLST
jgi:hypothetical protein